MISYFKMRLILYIQVFTLASALLACLPLFLQIKYPSIIFMLLSVGQILLPKSNWYLILPNSRKSLLKWHLLESLLVFLIVTFFFLLLSYFFEKQIFYSSFSISVQVFTCAIFGVLRALTPLNTPLAKRPTASLTSKERLFHFRIIAVAVIGYALAMTLFRNNLLQESYIHLVIAVWLICFMPLLPMTLLVFPKKTLLKWKRRSFVSSISIVFLVSLITLWGVFISEPSSTIAKWSSVIYGNLPIPIPQDRLLALAKVPDGAVLQQFEKLGDVQKSQVSSEEWKARTKACTTSECLNVSDVLIPSDISYTEKMSRFYQLMTRCYPGMKTNGNLRCYGIHLSGERLENRLNELVESKTALSWLNGTDELEQFIAIRALSNHPLSKDNVARMKYLQNSSNEDVKKAASLYFIYYDGGVESKGSTAQCSPSDMKKSELL